MIGTNAPLELIFLDLVHDYIEPVHGRFAGIKLTKRLITHWPTRRESIALSLHYRRHARRQESRQALNPIVADEAVPDSRDPSRARRVQVRDE